MEKTGGTMPEGGEGYSPEPEPRSRLRDLARGAGVPQLDDEAAAELQAVRDSKEQKRLANAKQRREELLSEPHAPQNTEAAGNHDELSEAA
jgi:hypothetical protein